MVTKVCQTRPIYEEEKQARKLQATLVWNYDPATDSLTDRGEV